MVQHKPSPRDWAQLIAMAVTAGVIALDETAVGVTLPTIRQDLAMTAAASHWVVNS